MLHASPSFSLSSLTKFYTERTTVLCHSLLLHSRWLLDGNECIFHVLAKEEMKTTYLSAFVLLRGSEAPSVSNWNGPCWPKRYSGGSRYRSKDSEENQLHHSGNHLFNATDECKLLALFFVPKILLNANAPMSPPQLTVRFMDTGVMPVFYIPKPSTVPGLSDH